MTSAAPSPAAPAEDRQSRLRRLFREYGILTLATLLLDLGVYFFKFPNNFSFGGVTGISIVLNRLLPWSAASYNFAINMALLVVGFVFIGRSFGVKTVYVSVLSSAGLSPVSYTHLRAHET